MCPTDAWDRETYSDYDAVGNRTYEKRGTDETYYEYDATNALTRMHELTGDEWTCFAYDKRGNCTEIEECDGTTYFQYNDSNLVTSIKYKNDVVNRFYYDSRLRRYAIEDSAGLAYFTYDQDGLCQLVERDESGSVVAQYTQGYAPIAGIGDMAAARIITGQGTYYRYDFYDNRGNVIRTVDESRAVTGYFEYDAWGSKLRDDPPPEGTRFGQSAPAWIELTDDPDGDLRLTPTRLYHASMGRFLQRGIQTQIRGGPGYLLAVDSPNLFLDPSGEQLVPAAYPRIAAPQTQPDDARFETEGSDHIAVPNRGTFSVGITIHYLQNYRTNVDIQYTPTEFWEKCCDSFRFVQMNESFQKREWYLSIMVGGTRYWPWHIDGTIPFRNEEWYPPHKGIPGHLAMTDTPGGGSWGWYYLKQDFETCVVCCPKTSFGTVLAPRPGGVNRGPTWLLGCVRWGHAYDKLAESQPIRISGSFYGAGNHQKPSDPTGNFLTKAVPKIVWSMKRADCQLQAGSIPIDVV